MNFDSNEKLVFMHFPKTAGTSLHSLLVEYFNIEDVCPERITNLSKYSEEELDRYLYYSGHFSISDVELVPNPKKVITFLRDPIERVLSLYYFWRAHTEEVIEKNNLVGPRLAKSLSLLEFLKHRQDGIAYNIENVYLTNLIFTRRSINTGVNEMVGDPQLMIDLALDKLREMYFVGFKERYEEDVSRLFRKLQLKVSPTSLKIKKQDYEEFGVTPNLEKVERQYINDEIQIELERVTCYDRKIYDFAWEMFTPTGEDVDELESNAQLNACN